MFTPAELAAEHARAMRIVKAVLAACDARGATARAARAEGFKEGDAPWVLAIGKAAIGMAEGMKDVCGEPRRHLIVTVDGPAAGSLTNIIRSDHPLPTQRSLDAGQAVKRFIEEAKAAGAPSLTVLMSGGASALICEPIPGLELEEYREVVRAMLEAGWNIQQMNTVRRAIDLLKGGELAVIASPLPIDQFLVSDVIGDAIHDIGSGPFVSSPTTPEDASELLSRSVTAGPFSGLLDCLSFRPHPPSITRPRCSVVVCSNSTAVDAAILAVCKEGFELQSVRQGLTGSVDEVCQPAVLGEDVFTFQRWQAVVWGGEWTLEDESGEGYGGRSQALALKSIWSTYSGWGVFVLSLATDGVDGRPTPGSRPAAGALCWTTMYVPNFETLRPLASGPAYQASVRVPDARGRAIAVGQWVWANTYQYFALRDAERPPHEPPAHIFTGPTGTNVNDLLIAWRVK